MTASILGWSDGQLMTAIPAIVSYQRLNKATLGPECGVSDKQQLKLKGALFLVKKLTLFVIPVKF